MELLLAMMAGAVLVIFTTLIHYEALRLLNIYIPRLRITDRPRLLFVVFGVFAAHTLEIWIYALAYWGLVEWWELGSFGGEMDRAFTSYLYFSTVSYTSLGLGDVYPLGSLRLISGIEALNGLVLIAWSASFTYLEMQKFWDK